MFWKFKSFQIWLDHRNAVRAQLECLKSENISKESGGVGPVWMQTFDLLLFG